MSVVLCVCVVLHCMCECCAMCVCCAMFVCVCPRVCVSVTRSLTESTTRTPERQRDSHF